MLRDRFKNSRKPSPPASSGGPLASQPAAAATPRNEQSRSEDQLPGASAQAPPELAVNKTNISQEAAAYADELKSRGQASLSKGSAPSALGGADHAALFEVGDTIHGLYQIEAQLSRGGMGCIYRVQHLVKGIPVVLKVLLQHRKTDDPAFRKFVQECKIAMTIAHPNVVTIYDWGIFADTLAPYLILEFLPGQSLREILSAVGKVPVDEAASLLVQACAGLDAVHQEEVIHRDLKPENLMVQWEDDGSPEGRMALKILDFGVAQLHDGIDITDRGRAVGTLNYMSPEQVQAKPVDLRTDIYAMGVVFYEMITGRAPFIGSTPRQTMSMHVCDPHIPASQLVSMHNGQAVDAVVAKCLAKDREQRYRSARELSSDLLALSTAQH